MERRRNPPRRVVVNRQQAEPGGQQQQDEPDIILHPEGDRVDVDQPPGNNDVRQPPDPAPQRQHIHPVQDPHQIGNIVDAIILELQRRGIALPAPGPAPVDVVIANPHNNQPGIIPRPQLMDTPMPGRYRAKDPPTFGGERRMLMNGSLPMKMWPTSMDGARKSDVNMLR